MTSYDIWYQPGAQERYLIPTKELDHRRPGKVKEKGIKVNTRCQRDSVEVGSELIQQTKNCLCHYGQIEGHVKPGNPKFKYVEM